MTATALLRDPRAYGPTRLTALVALGLVRARRGDPGSVEPLDEALELAGDVRAAAAPWQGRGYRYEAALALASGGPDEPAEAPSELQELGAAPAAALVAGHLREHGVRRLPRGLTARELEVLALMAEGLRNARFAERLFLSLKTVEHHFAAILRKLGARTRGEAAATATRIGLVGT